MKQERYHLLDGLRGVTLISMILYHGMFDLVELYGVQVHWFWDTPGYVWQQSICWTFILLSGFCWQLGSTQMKRGLTIFGCGAVITAVTCLFMPSERILFGILTFTGSAMLLMIPLSGILSKTPAGAGCVISGLLFFVTRNVNQGYFGFASIRLGNVPRDIYQGYFMTFLGFPQPDFFSSDYFSLVPWVFLYLCGYFLYGVLMSRKPVKDFLKKRAGVLEWIGKHSLPLYMIHQPILMAVFEFLFRH